MTKKDQEIIQAIKASKDSKVLNYLYETTLLKVKSYILKNNGSEEEAKDIFQEAVVVFYRYVLKGKFNEKYDIDGFIFVVAKNLWIHQALENKKSFSLENAPVQMEDENMFVEMISDEKKAVIKEVMGQIGDACRKILEFSIFNKIPMKEIAQIMHFANENVAKTTNYRCKQKIAQLIKSNKSYYSVLRG